MSPSLARIEREQDDAAERLNEVTAELAQARAQLMARFGAGAIEALNRVYKESRLAADPFEVSIGNRMFGCSMPNQRQGQQIRRAAENARFHMVGLRPEEVDAAETFLRCTFERDRLLMDLVD